MTPEGPLRATPNSGAFELRSSTRAARAVVRVRLGVVGLVGIVLTGLVVCVSAANTGVLLPESVRPVPSFLAGPFGVGGPDLRVGVLMGLLTAMFGCYLLVMRAADRLSARHVLMAIAALYTLVLLAPPLLSTDVFSYQAYGRMWEIYGANPYLNGPHVLFYDQLYPYIGAKWVNTPTSYGPLFTLLSLLLANLSGNANVAIAASALAYKAIATLACLGTIALLWNAARLRGLNPVRAVALFGAQPACRPLRRRWRARRSADAPVHHRRDLCAALAPRANQRRADRDRGGDQIDGLSPAPVRARFSASRRAPAAAGARFSGSRGDQRGDRARRFRRVRHGRVQPHLDVANRPAGGRLAQIPGFLSEGLGLGGVSRITGLVLGLIFVVAFTWLLRRVWRNQMDWIDGAGWATFAMLLTAARCCPGTSRGCCRWSASAPTAGCGATRSCSPAGCC